MADSWVTVSKEDFFGGPETTVKNNWVDITPEEFSDYTVKQAESLISRFGKQFYNTLVAQTAGGTIKTLGRGAGFGQYPIIGGAAPYMAKKEAEQWKETAKAGEKWGTQITQKLAAEVSPPETWKEKGIDMAAGIAGITAQIILLRQVVPTGTPEAVIWEIQNLLTGGKPGMGALYGSTIAGVSKLPASEAAKAAAEAASFYSLARIQGAKQSEALGRAAIPAALRGVGALRRQIKYRGIETEPQIITRRAAVSEKVAKEVVGIHRLGKLPIEQPSIESVTQKVSDWSKGAKVLRATEVKKALRKLRIKQSEHGAEIVEVEKGKGTPTWNAISRSKAGYKGKASVPEVTPLPLTKAEKELLANKVMQLYPEATRQFKRTNTITAIDKMVNGTVPADFEFKLLEPVLGIDKTIELYKQIKPTPSITAGDIPRVIWQSAKFVVGADVQTVRQLSGYAALEPKLYGKAVGIATKTYGKGILGEHDYFKQQVIKVTNDPRHAQAVKKGVNFYGYRPYEKTTPGTRPEWVMGQIPEKLTTLGLKRGKALKTLSAPLRVYGRWLTVAEESNIAGVNTFQQLLWNKGAEQLELTAKSPQQLNIYLKNYAKTLNTFSKILQAETPSGREIQSAAQWILFSPSMTVARPLSLKAIVANKGSRAYAAQLLATNVAKITALSGLIKLAGIGLGKDVDSEINPLSGDWGKMRIGNTHVDPHGGDAQFYRTLARLAVGAYVNTVGGGFPTRIGKWKVQTPQEIIKNYGETRETAAITFAKQFSSGRDFWGEKIPRWKILTEALTPQMLTDFFKSLMSDGTLIALLAGGAATMSAGVMVYPESAWQKEQDFKDEVAETAHNLKWDELTNIQQSALRLKNNDKFKEFELKKKQERKLRPAEISLEEQRKAGQWIVKQLNSKQKRMVEESGVSVDISRTIGDWWLNDKRYRKYRRLTAKYLKEGLERLEKNTAWQTTRDARLVQFVVDTARMRARMEVKRGL